MIGKILAIAFCIFMSGILLYTLKKSKESLHIAKTALYPTSQDFQKDDVVMLINGVRVERPSLGSKSWKWNNVITYIAILIMVGFTGVYAFTDLVEFNSFVFFLPMYSVAFTRYYKPSFGILPEGMLLGSEMIQWVEIKWYSVHPMTKWHVNYGAHPELKFGYEIKISKGKKLEQPLQIVLRAKEKSIIEEYLIEKGIEKKHSEEAKFL